MKLREFDEQCVRITDKWDHVYEGICMYNDKEYNEAEFGKREESLQILSVMFYKGTIQKVESLENHQGPYGRFTEPYGELEELLMEDGVDSFEDAFDIDEYEHLYRLMVYLEDHFTECMEKGYFQIDGLLKEIQKLRKYITDVKILGEMENLVKKCKEFTEKE